MSNVYMTGARYYLNAGLNGCAWINFDPSSGKVEIEGDFQEIEFSTKETEWIEDAEDFYEFVGALNDLVKQMKEFEKHHRESGEWKRDVTFSKKSENKKEA